MRWLMAVFYVALAAFAWFMWLTPEPHGKWTRVLTWGFLIVATANLFYYIWTMR